MPNAINVAEILAFPAVSDAGSGNWEEAEVQCLRFPELYLRKCRELSEAQQGLTEALDHGERQLGFVIRNLVDVVESCRSADVSAVSPQSRQIAGETVGAAEELPGEAAPYSPANKTAAACETPATARATQLESVSRSLVYILEELGVRRVDLVNTTYDGVVVDGRKIADPFEVVSSTQAGKASERKVTEVLGELWVDVNGRVVKKGLVIC